MTLERTEAPVTFRAYLMCAFAAFAGILFGYDSGYVNGVLGTNYFINHFGSHTSDLAKHASGFEITSNNQSLIVSILSAGTFFGAIFSGALADWIGRRTTIIAGCGVFAVGVIIQISAMAIPQLVVGRLIAGVGVGFVSAINILYMSEVAPKGVRGAIVSCYQFAITIGLMLASIVTNAVKNRNDSGAYRIPIGIQFAWALILAIGLALLPESPRFFVRKQQLEKAANALARVRGQPVSSEYVQDELAEIQANYEYEMQVGEVSWLGCFTGGIGNRNSNIRKVFIGTFLQMFQQWTGVVRIHPNQGLAYSKPLYANRKSELYLLLFVRSGLAYSKPLHTDQRFSTIFFTQIGFQNPFLISMITTIVNVCSTPISFYTIEKFGRRPLLIWGAVAMCLCQYIVAIIGQVDGENVMAQKAMVAFVCIYIFFFASTWGPTAWVSIGEIFPLPIRSKGVAMSTASNWFWNCIIGTITPYMMGEDYGNLGTKVFWVWGSLCATCIVFAYFMVPETKGLSLEQVDKMMEEVSARNSAKWVPHETFSHAQGMKESTQVIEISETTKA